MSQVLSNLEEKSLQEAKVGLYERLDVAGSASMALELPKSKTKTGIFINFLKINIIKIEIFILNSLN